MLYFTWVVCFSYAEIFTIDSVQLLCFLLNFKVTYLRSSLAHSIPLFGLKEQDSITAGSTERDFRGLCGARIFYCCNLACINFLYSDSSRYHLETKFHKNLLRCSQFLGTFKTKHDFSDAYFEKNLSNDVTQECIDVALVMVCDNVS